MSNWRGLHSAQLLLGLFFVTFATLMLEVLDTRLLSVLTWYHLSFLAVSVAMLGMSAGAVLVFARGDWFAGERARQLLPSVTTAFAVMLPLSHIANLVIPFPIVRYGTAGEIAGVAVSTLILTIPFVISGVAVAIALTRTSDRVGLLYGADLVGAAAGCLAIVALLELTDITSTAFAAAAAASIGAFCFARHVNQRGHGALFLAAVLLLCGVVNANARYPLGVMYPKSRGLWMDARSLDYSAWNAHSNVIVRIPMTSAPFLWGPASDAPKTPVRAALAAIDGDAGTVITHWDGDPASLAWVQYDVTSLPYRIRNGDVAIIGVGGGRDVLTAIWARNPRITGIEINSALIRILTKRYRDITKIADHPSVTLVHDEARSFLTRQRTRYDVLQMSLIDTWAATGAGAFTLSENGLYTREGWQVFLEALTPTGVFSVSRWYDPGAPSETTRLLGLGVAALLDFGVEEPRRHLVLVTRERVATLMISPSPFTDTDGRQLRGISDAHGFRIEVSPWNLAGGSGELARIAASSSLEALDAATRHPYLDFSPPTDRRPFFFNMLKPAGLWEGVNSGGEGIVAGNLGATRTLIALCGVALTLVVAIIGWPLSRTSRPRAPRGVFPSAAAYFAIIGLGFMFVQIPFLQRFSVYLGHPTYTFSIILFLMILAAGLGSFASERLDVGNLRVLIGLPLTIAAIALLELLLLQHAIVATVAWNLPGRTLVVASFVVPLAFALGFCFPLGLRLVNRSAPALNPWMWGINGACGVMASIIAVMVSMWTAIDVNLLIAAGLYLLLVLPIRRLSAFERTALAGQTAVAAV
jgi:hypothetical protein